MTNNAFLQLQMQEFSGESNAKSEQQMLATLKNAITDIENGTMSIKTLSMCAETREVLTNTQWVSKEPTGRSNLFVVFENTKRR